MAVVPNIIIINASKNAAISLIMLVISSYTIPQIKRLNQTIANDNHRHSILILFIKRLLCFNGRFRLFFNLGNNAVDFVGNGLFFGSYLF